jgi:hypothetical protein
MNAKANKPKTLSEKLLDVVRAHFDMGRTFKGTDYSREYGAGFHAGVSAVSDKLHGMLRDVQRFERTDTVRMADESGMFDALQWNLAQYRQIKAILSCEGQAHFVEDCIIKALESVLAGEKMEKVRL